MKMNFARKLFTEDREPMRERVKPDGSPDPSSDVLTLRKAVGIIGRRSHPDADKTDTQDKSDLRFHLVLKINPHPVGVDVFDVTVEECAAIKERAHYFFDAWVSGQVRQMLDDPEWTLDPAPKKATTSEK